MRLLQDLMQPFDQFLTDKKSKVFSASGPIKTLQFQTLLKGGKVLKEDTQLEKMTK